ncbi:MAG: ankyrin repeat domain-containing protein [Bacteroidales bacterium]|nr:ankyrin repeat domain-containing protein [Bacteroidales bacterium]MBN2817696.1 ankyrin repeat domain-containing protein [Bacteroidales bacterium]
MNKYSLVISLTLGLLSTNIKSQQTGNISSQALLAKYDSIQQSDYLQLLKYIYAGNISEVKEIITSQKFNEIEKIHRFTLTDYNSAVKVLNSLNWESENKLSLEGKTIYYFNQPFLSLRLLDSVASIIVTNYDGRSFVKFFEKGLSHNSSPVQFAFEHNKLEIFKLLLDQGYKIHANDIVDNKNLLFSLIKQDSIQFFKRIYKNIENPELIHFDGLNMLHYSALVDKPDFFDFLMEHGFDINKPTASGQYPIHFAAQASASITERILKTNPNHKELADANGKIPIHYTALEGDREILTILLKNKTEINPIDDNGATPLLLASKYNSTYFIDNLLSNGADFTARDNTGKGNMLYAVDGGKCYNLTYFLKDKRFKNELSSLSELRDYAKKNNASCQRILVLTRAFHTEFKFQLNLTQIEYEGATYLVSGGYGVEFYQRLIPYIDLSYGLNRLYIESGIRDTDELTGLELSDEHHSSYETNYIEHIISLKLYPVHYLVKTTPYLRTGISLRSMKESGLLGSSSIIVDNLSEIANTSYTGIIAGLGFQARGPAMFSLEINYIMGLTDVNTIYPGSYNTFAFVMGLGF